MLVEDPVICVCISQNYAQEARMGAVLHCSGVSDMKGMSVCKHLM